MTAHTLTKPTEPMTVAQAIRAMRDELRRAREKFPPMHSAHEGYAIIKEELEELWDDIKADCPRRIEAIQIGAMVLAMLSELPLHVDKISCHDGEAQG